jgi:hypothetical protein
MCIVRFIEPEIFNPEAIAVMSEAFDRACKELHDVGQPEVVLEVIAERIIDLARTGGRYLGRAKCVTSHA